MELIPVERRVRKGASGVVRVMTMALVAFTIAFAMVIPFVPASRAATTFDVQIVNLAFQPSDVTIFPGDTVRWTNTVSTIHSVVSDVGSAEAFTSPTLGQNDVFTYTFDNEGSFAYHCGQHSSMHGTVHVTTLVPEFSSLPIVLVGLLAAVVGLTRVLRKG